MNCYKVRSLISAYVDGELRGVEMLAMRQHLHDCFECNGEFESILHVKRSIGSLAPVHCAPDLAMRICEQIANCATTHETGIFLAFRRRFNAFPAALKLAGVGAVLILIASFFVSGQNTDAGHMYGTFSSASYISSLEQAGLPSVVSPSNVPYAMPLRPRPDLMYATDNWGLRTTSPVVFSQPVIDNRSWTRNRWTAPNAKR